MMVLPERCVVYGHICAARLAWGRSDANIWKRQSCATERTLRLRMASGKNANVSWFLVVLFGYSIEDLGGINQQYVIGKYICLCF